MQNKDSANVLIEDNDQTLRIESDYVIWTIFVEFLHSTDGISCKLILQIDNANVGD